MWRRRVGLAGLVAACGLVGGCGSSTPGCVTAPTLEVSPAAGTAVAAAAAPGNRVQFQALSGEAPVNPRAACAIPAHLRGVPANWTSADAVHISISSAADATNGLATCLGATSGAVTLTASYGTGTAAKTATAQLTCR